MAFGNKSDQEVMSEINVTSLVDVMLVLLVVFIVTAPLLTQSMRVNLPKTFVTAPAPEDHLANINIDAQGDVFLNTQKVVLDSLGSQLQDILQRDPELMVQFNADTDVHYGRVAEVMAISHHAGITKLSFLTREQ